MKLSKKLTETYLSLLRESVLSGASVSIISANVDLVQQHLISYFNTPDHNTIRHLLSTSSRNSLETPFLFLGDIHPNFIITLLRSFINRKDQGPPMDDHLLDIVMKKIEVIGSKPERWTTAIRKRLRAAQIGYATRVSEKWISSYHSQEGRKEAITMVNDALTEKEEGDLLRIIEDANHLRSYVIGGIVSDLTVYQSAFFLEALCQIFVGIKDQEEPHCSATLHTPFKASQDVEPALTDNRRDNKVLLSNFINGIIAVPSYYVALGTTKKWERNIVVCVFVAAIIGATNSTFVASMIRGKSRHRSAQDALWAMLCFFLGGFLPVLAGLLVTTTMVKIPVNFALTSLLLAGVLICNRKKTEPTPSHSYWLLGSVTAFVITCTVALSDIVGHIRRRV